MADEKLIKAIDTLSATRDEILLLTVLFASQDVDLDACAGGAARMLESVGCDLLSIADYLDEQHAKANTI